MLQIPCRPPLRRRLRRFCNIYFKAAAKPKKFVNVKDSFRENESNVYFEAFLLSMDIQHCHIKHCLVRRKTQNDALIAFSLNGESFVVVIKAIEHNVNFSNYISVMITNIQNYSSKKLDWKAHRALLAF